MKTTKPCSNCSDTSYSVVAPSFKMATTTVTQLAAACPECGGLECLCRPRFFDGQLLSADDLNRLEAYIVKKNRLHNRTLHGWGVVCGLEVVCDPCEDRVIVRQGYALSPCGDDIIVCENVAVPICELIKQCRNTAAYDDCYSGRLNAEERGCEEALEDWNLLICYDEKPSRGITPLRSSSGAACCSRCACGGSSSCGCSCHEKSTSVSKTSSGRGMSSSRVSPQCEPSVICEGFHFEVRKVPPQARGKSKALQGEMIDRFRECYRELFAVLPEFPQPITSPDQLRQFCCDVKTALKEFFAVHSTYACLVDESLARIVCPSPDQFPDTLEGRKYYKQLLHQALLDEVMVAAEYLRYCVCSLLQPPCPEPAADNCVPIATVKIRRTDCKIIDVCNITGRRFAVTLPNLAYWFSGLPIDQFVRKQLAKLCCGTILEPSMEFNVGDLKSKKKVMHTQADVKTEGAAGVVKESAPSDGTPFEGAAQPVNTEAEFKTVNANQDMASILAKAWTRGTADRLDLPTMILGAMGASNAEGQPLLTAEELRNPLTALLVNQIAMPMVGSFLPQSFMNITSAVDLKRSFLRETPSVSAVEMESVRAEVAKLTQLVSKQQRTINTLSKKLAVKTKIEK